MEVTTSRDLYESIRNEKAKIRVNKAQGHVFAGATLPFGMAKAVADSINDNAGGYASDGGPSKFYYETEACSLREKAAGKKHLV